MRNKLLIGPALFAAAIMAASCEKTPSGEQSADTQKQSAPATPERQPGATPQQQAGQEQGTQTKTSEAQQLTGGQGHADQSTAQDSRDATEPQGTQSQKKAEQPPSGDQGAQAQDQKNTDGEARQPEGQQDRSSSPGLAQSDRGVVQEGQTPPSQPQQSQAQQTQPPQNSQVGGGAPGRVVSLNREQIRQAQTVLKEKGFDVGVVDGILGPRTRKALIAFQQQRGLQATGQMDQRTVTALGIATGLGQEHSRGTDSTTTGHSGTEVR